MTEDEKRTFLSDTFKYEVQMLCYSCHHLMLLVKKLGKKKNLTPVEQSNYNMPQECFLLHVRNLLEFFYCKKKYIKDDIRIFDFITDYSEIEKIKPYDFDSLMDNISKRLAHPTKRRIDGSIYDWKYKKRFSELIEIIKEFFNELENFEREINEIKKYLA